MLAPLAARHHMSNLDCFHMNLQAASAVGQFRRTPSSPDVLHSQTLYDPSLPGGSNFETLLQSHHIVLHLIFRFLISNT